MLDKNKAFNTTGDSILQNGTEIERKTGLAWFDTNIKKVVEDLVENKKKHPLLRSAFFRLFVARHLGVIELANAAAPR